MSVGPYFQQFETRSELHVKYATPRYRVEGVLQLLALVDSIVREDFGQIQAPTLCVYTDEDKVVDTSKIVRGFQRIGAGKKELVNLRKLIPSEIPTGHTLAGDILSPATNDTLVNVVVRFLHTSIPEESKGH